MGVPASLLFLEVAQGVGQQHGTHSGSHLHRNLSLSLSLSFLGVRVRLFASERRRVVVWGVRRGRRVAGGRGRFGHAAVAIGRSELLVPFGAVKRQDFVALFWASCIFFLEMASSCTSVGVFWGALRVFAVG